MILNVPKIPPAWKCNLRSVTLAAIGSGLGAAAGYQLIPWYFLILPLCGCILLNFRQFTICAISFVIALTSGIIQLQSDRSRQRLIPAEQQELSGKVICIDRRTSALDALLPLSVYKCEVHLGKTILEAVAAFPEKTKPLYGDVFEFNGTIYPVQPLALKVENGKITGSYPPQFGNRPLLDIKELAPAGKCYPVFRFFVNCRDILLKRLLCKLHDRDIMHMSAQLFFGASGGAPPEKRRNFVNSGTIHLFSVSGLHVTITSAIILLLCRWIPFRSRHIMAALFTLFYVLCTGASLPAVRAGIMIISWCILRSMLFYSPAWNAMMLSWCAFAICDPESVGSLSAQYSFGITAALLMITETGSELYAQDKALTSVMPPRAALTRRTRRKLRWKQRLFLPLLSTTTAFAAGCGISLFRQSLFTPASVPANLLLIVLTPLLFGAMLFKMLLGGVFHFCDSIGAYMLEATFNIIINTTGEISKFFAPIAADCPPIWNIILYTLAFYGALGLKTPLYRKCCLITAILLLFSWFLPFYHPHPRLLVISTAGKRPPLLALKNPGSSHVEIIDLPDRKSSAAAGLLLRKYGADRATVTFSSAYAGSIWNLPQLAKHLDISLNRIKISRKNLDILRSFDNVSYSGIPGNTFAVRHRNGTTFCRLLNGTEITSKITDNGRYVKVRTPHGKSYEELLPNDPLPVVWECELK